MRTSQKNWLACWEKLQHSLVHERGRGRFESWYQAEWLCSFGGEGILIRWHKWPPASSSITANKYIWVNYQSGGEFLKNHFELIGSAHTDGSPVYSNCPCSVNNCLHTAPLISVGLHQLCHHLSMCICVFDWIHWSYSPAVCILYEGGFLFSVLWTAILYWSGGTWLHLRRSTDAL